MLTEEQKPFLDRTNEDESVRGSHVPCSYKTRNRVLVISVISNAVLLPICLLLSAILLSISRLNTHSDRYHGEVEEPYSPANEIIEYEYRSMMKNDTRFRGHPGPEWKQYFSELMSGTLFRISDEELALSGSDSIPLEGDGYAAGLGVAHSLHCVKKIKEFIYHKDIYPGMDETSGEFLYLQDHADHCLDFLRQGSLCNLDYSLYTVYWGARRQDIPTHNVPKVQKCVNWDKLHKWMEGRAASTDELIGP
ncbi:hypothetical protein P170DRAFT_467317 [Aspergillus steynii IBT 23096]|uniref:Tat pathway signal sequence n=1 Tax=Aspergillus steynii IBT 23096 TaxID=1392250 RepID=A0A2I2FZZ0_9EURO|nr:uncharacterized protein P170DRAFT_467317 [Aspergillus steynii IBT 23096]PLB46208.1 hypothetical protein P170DRAFT_467317 [Aspergillus steynii IBT 23096]